MKSSCLCFEKKTFHPKNAYSASYRITLKNCIKKWLKSLRERNKGLLLHPHSRQSSYRDWGFHKAKKSEKKICAIGIKKLSLPSAKQGKTLDLVLRKQRKKFFNFFLARLKRSCTFAPALRHKRKQVRHVHRHIELTAVTTEMS